MKDINIQEIKLYRMIYDMNRKKGAIAIEGKDNKEDFIIYLPVDKIMELIQGITQEYLHPMIEEE